LGTIPARHAILRRLPYSSQSSTSLWSWARLAAPAPLGRGPLQRLARATLARQIFSSSALSRSTQFSSSSTIQPGSIRLNSCNAPRCFVGFASKYFVGKEGALSHCFVGFVQIEVGSFGCFGSRSGR